MRRRGKPPRKNARRDWEDEEDGGEAQKGGDEIQEGEARVKKEGDKDQSPGRDPQSRKEVMRRKEEINED